MITVKATIKRTGVVKKNHTAKTNAGAKGKKRGKKQLLRGAALCHNDNQRIDSKAKKIVGVTGEERTTPAMLDAINKILGNELSLELCSPGRLAPGIFGYFSFQYDCYLASYLDKQYALLRPNAQWRLRRLIEQYRIFCKRALLPCALYIDYLSPKQRDMLLAESIPFIFSGGQAYLPLWQISILPDKFREPPYLSPKMASDTQALFLYLYYQYRGGKDEIDKRKVASKFGLDDKRLRETLNEFAAMRIINIDSTYEGNTIRLICNYTYFLLKARNRLKSPVENWIYLDAIHEEIKPTVPLSGIPALEKSTLIGPIDTDPGYAVARASLSLIPEERFISQQDFLDFGGYAVEVWGYDPNILAIHGVVDDISLILSLKDSFDERVQGQLDVLIRKHGLSDELLCM